MGLLSLILEVQNKNVITNKKELYAKIDELLEPEGFERFKETWYKQSDECITFVNIGKSDLGVRFGHVMGCFLKSIMIEKSDFPPFNKNHLKYSLRELTNKLVVNNVFDFEVKLYDGKTRSEIIGDLITNHAIPFLNQISSVQGIKQAYDQYPDLKYFMNLKLKIVLNLPLED